MPCSGTPHFPQEAGRICRGEPPEGGRGHRFREVPCGDRSGGAAREEGRENF